MINWQEVILTPDDTMEKAVQTLDRTALGILLVSDEVGRLIGTITDGDIRRALIRHKGMQTVISDFTDFACIYF